MRSVVRQRGWWGGKLRRTLSATLAGLLGASVLAIAAAPASAGPNPSIDSSPSNATTATALEWTFSNANPASCELTEGATTVVALTDCTSPADYDVSADAGGSYTFTVYASDAADVVVGTTPSATSTVDVAPVAPTITAAPTTPDNDSTPSWSFTLPTGATATCEIDDPASNPVDTVTGCTSPYTASDLNSAPANGVNGTYHFSVTPTAGGVTGAAAISTYDFDTIQPAAPNVTADATTGFSVQPTFTVGGLVGGSTLTCSVTGPGPAVTVKTCGTSSVLDLTGGSDGSYTLHVTQTEAGNVSAEGTASYLLDTHTPATPTVTAPTSPGTDTSPTFTISGIEAGGTPQCTVTGPSAVPAPTCGSSTTLDLSGAGEGTYTLTVTVQDAAGKDSAPASAPYEFEAGGPAVPVVTAPSSPSNSRAPLFTVSDTDPVDLTYDCTVSGPTSVTTSECGPDTVIDLAGAADGTYQLSVVAIDGLGQAGPAGLASYTLDTTPPPAPVVTGPSSPSSITSPSFGITEAEPGTTLSCSLDGPISFPIPPAQCADGIVLDLSGSGHDGVYTLSVTATDPAGNVSSVGTATYTLDTTPPPLPVVVAPPSPANDLTPTFTYSDSEVGVSLTCVLRDPSTAIVASGTCPVSGTFNTAADPLDGTYRLTVTAADAAGNKSRAGANWTRDTTPPPAPVVTAPPSPSNDLTPSFTVTDSETGVTFTCTLTGPGSSTVFSGTCPPGNSLDLSGFGDGSYMLSVTATDPAGNIGPAGHDTYVLDTTAPPVPTIALLAPVLSPGNSTSPQFMVTDSEAGVTFVCSVSGVTPVPPSAITCGSTTTIDLSGVGRDGDYTLSVSALDAAGNTSGPATLTYTLDTVAPPNPTVIAPPSPSNDLTPTFTVGDTEPDAILGCVLTGPGATTVYSNLCPANGTFDLTGFGDGTYSLTVTATDPAGNTAPSSATAVYVLDTMPPPAPTVVLSTPASSPGNDPVPQFTVSDSESGVTYSCSVSGPTPVPPSAITCGSTTTVDLTGAGRDGSYRLSVTATDAAGNTSTAGTKRYVLDTTPPPTPTVNLSNPASSPGSVTVPQFSVADTEAGVTYSCSVTGATPVPNTAITCGATTTVDLSGAGRDGGYTLSVTATDAAGNVSAPGTAVYTLDTTPPPAPAVTLTVPASSPGKVTAPQFSVTDSEVGVRLLCAVTGPTTVPGSAVACGATTTVDLSGAGRDGTYTLSVEAVDAAGNVSPAGTALYTLDTTAPPRPTLMLSSPTSSPSNDVEPSWTVTDTEAGVTFACTMTGPTTVPSTAISCGATTTVDLSGAGRDGTYTLSVTATDAAGNTSTVRNSTYKLDTTAPPVPTVTLTVPASSPGNVTAPQFTATDSESGDALACAVTGATTVPGSAITCGATTTVDLSGSGRDGSYTLSVTATDAAGNTSAAGTATYVLDTTAPPAPVVVSPGASTRLPTFGITDGDPTVVLTCSMTSPRGRTVFPLAPLAPPATCPANGTFDTTAFADGDYTLIVTATDPAGNATSTTTIWLRDTTPPPVPTVALAVPASSPSNVTAPQFSVSDTEVGVTYACSVTGPTAVPNSAIVCGTTTSVDLSGPGRDGLYTLSVTATDAAGNTSTAGTAPYVLDTTPPPTPSVSLSVPASSPGNVTAPQFAVSDTEAGVTYTCAVSGATAVPNSAVACGATTSVNLAGAGRDGLYTLSVTATDTAGNSSTTVGTASYVLDTTPPPVPVVLLSTPLLSPGNVVTPQFLVTDTEPGVTLTCSATGVTPVPGSAITCGPLTSMDLSGAGRDGAYTLSVTATDAAGNTSAAGTEAYTLDTTSPDPPVVGLASATRSSSRTPLWTWQFGFNDLTTAFDTAACTVNGPRGWTSTTTSCPHHFSTLLAGGDGPYTVTVTLTDEAGNSVSAVSPAYILDSTAPAGPTVFLLRPSSGAGLNRHPVWSVDGPTGSTLMCTLRQGGDAGTVVSPEAVCPNPTTFSLVGFADGLFTLEVVAVDAAGNTSFPAWSSYALVPTAPRVRAPGGQDASAVWTVIGNTQDTFICTLSRGSRVVNGPHQCGVHPTFAMTNLPAGTYTLSVVQVGAEGVRSAPGSASWFWAGPPTGPNPPGGGGHHPGGTGPKKHPKSPNPLTRIPGVVNRQIQKIKHEVSGLVGPFIHPLVHPNRLTQDVVKAVQKALGSVGSAGGGTGFPLLLLGLVLAFLLVQNRIDSRDPKLALASIAADDTVEFQPPPSRRDRP